MNSSHYNQLTLFLAIVNEGGIRQAARMLELTPPSVSQGLKRLEQQMGLPLIIRTTREMELTDAGRQLFERASPLVAELNELFDQVKELNQVPSGKLRLTLPGFAFSYLLKPIYAEFCQHYPQIDLELSVSDAIINLIKEGFDAGIRMAHRVEEGMVSIPLTPPIQAVLFASPDYIAEHGCPQTPDDLHQHRLISYRFATSNQLAPLMLSDQGQELTVEMPRGLIVNNVEIMIDAADRGLGIGGALYPMLKEHFQSGRLIPVLEQYWHSYPSLHLYFPQHSQKARRIRVLVDFLRERAIKAW